MLWHVGFLCHVGPLWHVSFLWHVGLVWHVSFLWHVGLLWHVGSLWRAGLPRVGLRSSPSKTTAILQVDQVLRF
ncbi:hypothetical protein DXV65_24375 [Pseudomonas fluorescens]|nr:hypothetical protein DXV65_24375 [Pseudomonas fluorescens]